MTPEHLQILIRQGENNKMEFKTRLTNQHHIAIVLSAFANTEGGYILFGVNDGGSILGLNLEQATATETTLRRLCASMIPYPCEIGSVGFNNSYVIYAKIERAPQHLQPITTANGESYIRKGDNNIAARSETLVYYENLEKQKNVRQIKGFVAMSFRQEEEPSLVDYFAAIKRAALNCNLRIVIKKLDEHEGDYEISQRIMDAIDGSDFVIVDYTLSPHNVYFESGYARGVRKRIIQIARTGTVLEFDVRNWPTTFYRNATELEEKLVLQLMAVYKELTENV